MPERGQLAAKLMMVVDLSVEDDDDVTALVAHRLRRGVGEVDDLQARMAERAFAADPRAALIGTAMRQRRQRGVEVGRRQPGLSATYCAEDAAHAVLAP